MFLGFSPVVTNWSAASDEFSLILDNNPLAEFAELPEGHEGLLFSNILCGVLRGALEMVKNTNCCKINTVEPPVGNHPKSKTYWFLQELVTCQTRTTAGPFREVVQTHLLYYGRIFIACNF